VSAPQSDSPARGSYDFARRRRTKRAGRERGCWLYIPGEELAKAGHEPGGVLPWYRVWGSKRGVVIRLYREG
jgi:hypothetical protein